MKKEILIAIIIGFALGLVITFGIWTANQSLKKQTQSEKPSQTEQTPTPTPAEEILLTITSPDDNLISPKEKIDVMGKTTPQAIIVIIYPEGEKFIQADEEGNFTSEIILLGGANEITITAYDEKDNETSRVLNVVYSTAEI